MVNTKIHSRLDYTFILCIYKVFKHLPMLWMNIRMYRYAIIAMKGGRTCWFWENTGYNPHKYDMVNTKIHSRLDYTFILCIYKVFKHLPMLWMYIRMYPYAIIAMEGGRTWWFGANTGYKPHKYDMVKTKIHSRLDYTFILCLYKVFKHLPMLWMYIRMYP